MPRPDRYDQTDEQRSAIKWAIDWMNIVGQKPAAGSIADKDRPYYDYMQAIGERESVHYVEASYVGSVAFILAHEFGHIALHHHALLEKMDRQEPPSARKAGTRYCNFRQRLEFEADLYALLLLFDAPACGPRAWNACLILEPFQEGGGYQVFFDYAYGKTEFKDDDDCDYPTREQRRKNLVRADINYREHWRGIPDSIWLNLQFNARRSAPKDNTP